MKKKILIILGIFLVIVLGTIVILRIFTPEDTWLCQNGSWVRHGNPSASMPTSICPSK